MANQQAIQGLQNNLASFTNQTKAINNDIANMTVGRAEQLTKLAQLGAKSATKLIGDFREFRLKNIESDAISDWYETQFDFFGDSEEATAAENVLRSNAESSTSLHTGLGKAREEGVAGHLVNESAKRHPIYGYTIAKLQLGKVGNQYAQYMQSMMTKSEQRIYLPDKVNADGSPYSYLIKDADTLTKKVAAHRWLRNKYFSDHNIGQYGKAFIALPTDRFGSGFLQSIQAAEQGKDGLFAKYQLESDIADNLEIQSAALAAFVETKDAASFQVWVDSLNAGIDSKGNRYTPTKVLQKTDDFVTNAIQGNMLTRSDIIKISDSIVPSSVQKTQNKKKTLTPIIREGKIIGYGLTRAQKWPQRWGYKNGYGKHMQTWRTALIKNNRDSHEILKTTWKKDSKQAIKEIKEEAQNAKEGNDILNALKDVYGDHVDFNYEEVQAAIHNIGTSPANVPAEIAALKEQIHKNKRISEINMSDDARKHPTIKNALAAQAQREKEVPGYEKYKFASGALLANVEAQLFKEGGYAYSTKNKGRTITTDEAATRTHFEDLFDHYTSKKGGKLSAFEAFKKVEEEFIKGGGRESHLVTQTDIDNVKDKGVESNIYSIDSNGNLLNRDSPALQNIYKTPPTVEEKVKYLELKQGGNVLAELSAINENNEPTYKLTEEPTKESADYNKILWDSRMVPDHIIEVAKNTNQSISDVVQARLTAWGHGDLDPKIKEMLGTDLLKYLPGGIQNRLFGDDDGFYKPYAIPARIAQSNPPNTVLEHIDPSGQIIASSEAAGVDPNINYAAFNAIFGMDATQDLTTEGFPEWSDIFSKSWTDLEFQKKVKEIPLFSYFMYAQTGNPDHLPLLDDFNYTWDIDPTLTNDQSDNLEIEELPIA